MRLDFLSVTGNAMQVDLYCKVYVAGSEHVQTLAATVAAASGADVRGRTVKSDSLEIDVFRQGRHEGVGRSDDFVHWPHYLEVFAADNAEWPDFIRELAYLLNHLQSMGLQVVASCDFESELATARRPGP